VGSESLQERDDKGSLGDPLQRYTSTNLLVTDMTFEQWYVENIKRDGEWYWDYKNSHIYKAMERAWDAGWEQGREEGYEDGRHDFGGAPF
jgi:hypothetical protein